VILLILYNTSDSSTFFSQESLIKMTPSKTNCFELNDSKQNKVRQLNYQNVILLFFKSCQKLM